MSVKHAVGILTVTDSEKKILACSSLKKDYANGMVSEGNDRRTLPRSVAKSLLSRKCKFLNM